MTDIQWDSDISLEGKNLAYSYKGIDGLELFSNIGNYIVKESTQYDDYIVAIQQFGAKWQINTVYGLETAMTKLYRTRPNGDDLPTASASMVLGNASIDTRALKFNIDTQALGVPFVQRVSVFGEEYVNASKDSYGNCNMGNANGLEIGTQKLAVLGDSDVYGGAAGSKAGLNTKGTELEFKLALAENATIGVDQYLIDIMNNGYSDATGLNNDKGFQRVAQFDVNVKF